MKVLVLALLAGVVAVPAGAQSLAETHADHGGALSGRSPVGALRPKAAPVHRPAYAFIHVPAGKPHTYGTHERPRAEAKVELAERETH